jgi:hypothetical protein
VYVDEHVDFLLKEFVHIYFALFEHGFSGTVVFSVCFYAFEISTYDEFMSFKVS